MRSKMNVRPIAAIVISLMLWTWLAAYDKFLGGRFVIEFTKIDKARWKFIDDSNINIFNNATTPT